MGEQGQEKMSKSDPASAIFMEDSAAEVKTKIKKAFCPPGVVSISIVPLPPSLWPTTSLLCSPSFSRLVPAELKDRKPHRRPSSPPLPTASLG